MAVPVSTRDCLEFHEVPDQNKQQDIEPVRQRQEVLGPRISALRHPCHACLCRISSVTPEGASDAAWQLSYKCSISAGSKGASRDGPGWSLENEDEPRESILTRMQLVTLGAVRSVV